MKSEALYRTLFETSTDAVMILDRNGFVDCNPTAVRIFGASCRDEILSKHPSELSPESQSDGSESKLAADKRIEQALGDGSVSFEWTHKRIDTGKPFFANVLLSRMEVGGQILVQASVRDISERKALEESLQESREKYRGLSEASFEAIFISEKGRCLEQNTRAQEMFGYTSEEAIGRMGTEWIAPEDREQVMRNMISGYEQPYEAKGLRKDGTTFPAVLRGKMMQYKGRLVRVTAMGDITERKLAETKLIESETSLRALFEAEPECIKIIAANGLLLQMNPAGLKMIEADSFGEVAGLAVRDLIAPEYRDAFESMHRRVIGGESVQLEYEIVGLKGTRRWMQTHAVPHMDRGQSVQLAVTRDVTERKQAQEAQRIAATAFESLQCMIVTDAQRVVLRVNKAFTEITGYSSEEAVGNTPRLLSSGRHDANFYAAMNESLAKEGSWQGEILNRRKSGEVFPEWLNISTVKDDAGQVTHYVAIFTDISDRKLAADRIESLAFYDPLTGLPNRRLLMSRLDQVVTVGVRHYRTNALLFVDLDNFKTLNDSLGHDQGDVLLALAAKRLTACIRDGDTVARLGGDEFVVMLEDLSKDDLEAATQAETVGEKIRIALSQPYLLQGNDHHCTPSIGITLFGGHQQEKNTEPLKRAELAMYQAKSAGRNAVRFFDPDMQAKVTERAAMELDLRESLLAGDFQLYYQPQLVGQGRMTGAEALVRWLHPKKGLVSPCEFIPLAEDTGLILPLGQWVLDTACAQLAKWATCTELAQLTVSVNVSARQFHHKEFVSNVLATISRTGANPRQLKLELTESLLVEDVEGIISKMTSLRAHGVGFSLDDFGTGYSSLSYLKRLPLDQLKIDQGFVKNILSDPNDSAIAKMVIALADSLGLMVIAEGVEIEAQRDFLARHGCHAYQGFLFSRPLPIDMFEALAKAAVSA
ncbi:MAG: PAS domain S-box protein [Rhodoferax sp.]|nr:PAS domain S-box protein [Rhodoferax sp.]MCF8209789.1 PAS domain S-box protein [Rhodoferax sp.]